MRTAIAALLAAVLLVACSRGPATVAEEEVAPEAVLPVETPPVVTTVAPVSPEGPPLIPPPGGLPVTPPPPSTLGNPEATETVVSLYGDGVADARSLTVQSVSVTDTVREGGNFRIRVGFEGRYPVEGSCTLGVADSHGESGPVTSRANGADTSAVVRVTHDNETDDGRTVTVSIDSCTFPDLDHAGVTYRIGERNTVSVAVTTAGPVEEDPNTYEFNISSLEWSDELHYLSQGDERMVFYVNISVSEPLDWDGLLHMTITENLSGETFGSGTHLYKGQTGKRAGFVTGVSQPGFERTVTVTLNKWQKTQSIVEGSYYAPPGGTFVIGERNTATATFITPEFARPPDPVYTVSVTPDPVTEGDKVMFHVDVQNIQGIYFTLKFRDNWRTADDIDQNAMWMNPENGGPTQSRERTTMVCCNGNGWLPEDERPSVRTYTGYLWQYNNLRASATVGLSSRE